MISKRVMKFNIGSYPVIIVCGVLIILSQLVFNSILYPLGFKEVFRLQTTFSSEALINVINSIGETGIQKYLSQFKLDFFFPVFYGMFFIALLTKLIKLNKAASAYEYLLLIPLFAAIFDELENILEINILHNYKGVNTEIIFISGVTSALKWVLALLCCILVLFLFAKVIYKKINLSFTK